MDAENQSAVAVPTAPFDPNKRISLLYCNHRGQTAIRTIVPIRVWFGSTEWHPEPQWLLEALDVEKGEERSFALTEVRAIFSTSKDRRRVPSAPAE